MSPFRLSRLWSNSSSQQLTSQDKSGLLDHDELGASKPPCVPSMGICLGSVAYLTASLLRRDTAIAQGSLINTHGTSTLQGRLEG